jgi:cytochrome P450
VLVENSPTRADDHDTAVHHVQLPDGRWVWMVNRYEEAREVLNSSCLSNDTSRMGANAPLGALPAQVQAVVAHDMLNMDPPAHTRLRRLVAQTFTNRRIAAMRPVVERIAGELLDAFGRRSEVDLVEEYAGPLPTRVLADLVGIPAEDCPYVQKWSDTFVSELLIVSEQLLEATTRLGDYARTLIRDKRARPADDLVSRLISARDEGDRLSDEELGCMVAVLLIAGQTATTQSIAKGVFLLLTHGDQLAKVRADPGLLPTAVDEFLRYEPPLRVSAFRMTTEPVTISATTIPAGEIVLCSLPETNRDQARFPAADRLDVCRPDNQHLAFGHGIHRCLGANLAKLEAEVAIGSLLSRFERIRLAVPVADLRWTETGIMTKLAALPVVLK